MSSPVMTRVSPETKAKLQAIARSTNRSEAYLAREAIEAFVAANEWQVAVTARRLAEVEAGTAELIPHEEVAAWLDSKGTDRELPMPGKRS